MLEIQKQPINKDQIFVDIHNKEAFARVLVGSMNTVIACGGYLLLQNTTDLSILADAAKMMTFGFGTITSIDAVTSQLGRMKDLSARQIKQAVQANVGVLPESDSLYGILPVAYINPIVFLVDRLSGKSKKKLKVEPQQD